MLRRHGIRQLKQTATATKTSLKKSARAASNFIALIPPRTIRQMSHFFLELNSKCIKVQENKEGVVVWCSRPSQNVTLGSFTSYSCNDGKEIYKKEREKELPSYWPRK